MAGPKANPLPATFFRYLPASPRDRAWGLYVTTGGYVKIEPEMGYPPPGHPEHYAWSWSAGRVLDEYQLHYIPQGGGMLEGKSGGRSRIGAGDFFLLFPDVWHRYAPDRTTGWDEYWVGFKGEQMDHLVKAGFFSPKKPVFRPQAEHGALEIFSDICSELKTEPFGFMQIIAAHTMQLLAGVLAGKKAREEESATAKIIRSAKQELRANLDRDIDLYALAKKLNTSYTWLRRTFRQHTGLPPHQYHLQLRLKKAMQLLAASDCTVKEAAARTGYTDEYYFSRLFKLKTGRAPEAWKRGQAHKHTPD